MTQTWIQPRSDHSVAGRSWAVLAATAVALGVVPIGARGSTDPGPKAAPPQPPASKQMTVTGRIIGPDGKGIPHGQLALIVQEYGRSEKPEGTFFAGSLTLNAKVVASLQADGDGRFRISGPGYSPSLPYTTAALVVAAPGHGLVLHRLDPAAPVQEATITLAPERLVRGRLIDLQGEPVVEAKIHVIWPEQEFGSFWFDKPLESLLPFWPRAVRSDDKGRFLIRGFSGAKVHIEVRHERYAPQQFDVEPVTANDAKEVTLSVVGMRQFQGQVTYSDTGNPAANVRIIAIASPDEFGMGYQKVEGRTDSQGRFSLSVFPGDFLRVVVHPTEATPYRVLRQVIPWAQAAKQETKLLLQRGILLHGMVKESPSGEPVAGARVQYRPRENNNPFYRRESRAGSLEENLETAITGADGRFQLTVQPGPGHLFVLAPTLDYVHVATSWGQLEYGRPGGIRYYPDGLAALDLKPPVGPWSPDHAPTNGEMTIKLHRGVTFKGRVVGPDGKPVERFWVFCRSYMPQGYEWWQRENALEGREGRFELPGCEPGKPCTVWLIDRTCRFGATAELSPEAARDPVTVQLQPCGSAVARFVNPEGKPAAGHFNGKPIASYYPFFSMVITPGAVMAGAMFTGHDDHKDLEADWFNWQFAPPGLEDHRTDAQGRTTFAGLIPGATYRLKLPGLRKLSDQELADKGWPTKDFTVKPGQVLDLGEITVPNQ